MKWTGNNSDFYEIANAVMTHTPLPKAKCCNTPEIHVYFDEYGERAAGWVWCSKCGSFFHFSFPAKLITEWKNSSEIETSKLEVVPDYLEQMKLHADRAVQEYN